MSPATCLYTPEKKVGQSKPSHCTSRSTPAQLAAPRHEKQAPQEPTAALKEKHERTRGVAQWWSIWKHMEGCWKTLGYIGQVSREKGLVVNWCWLIGKVLA
jgi:hypothetical protein